MHVNYRAAIFVAAGALAGGLTLQGCNKPKAAMPQQGPPEVGVMVVKPARVQITTELPGRTSPYLIAEVRPQVGGIIKNRLFTEGSDVTAGDVLYEIDASTYQAAYASAKAALARAEANIVPVRLKAERYKELVSINAVSKQDYDDVSASLMLAEADIESAKAAVETARINLGYTRVTAPISGRIGRSMVTTGALVTSGQPAALTTIQQLNPIYVDVTQSAADLLRMKQNLSRGVLSSGGVKQAKVKLILEDGTEYPIEGTLKFSDVTVDQSTGSVMLRTLFSNPKNLLLPGMYVRAILVEGVNDRAILVPQRGVTRNPAGNPMVMAVGADDKVEPRIIKAERTVGDSWLVTEGLKPGDRVILEGLQKARPGTPVKVVPFGSPPAGAQAAAAMKK